MKGVSDPTSENHFWLHAILLLRTCIPLAPVTIGPNKLLLQTPMHITWVLLQPFSSFPRIESYWPSLPFVLRVSPNNANKFSRMTASSRWLHHQFNCFDILFCFHCHIYEYAKPLVTLWLVSVGSLGGTWTPSDTNNYLTQGLMLLKKSAEISNGNAASYESA